MKKKDTEINKPKNQETEIDNKNAPDIEENNENKAEELQVDEKLKITEEKLLRTLAESENQRRRFEKEKQEAFEFGGFNFARESLSLLDNIERAIASFKNDTNLKNNKDLNIIIEGIEIVKNDLVSIFKKNGIETIESINKKFDPNFHQAMLEIEDNTKEVGTVIQEIQKGYIMKGRLLRPSLVGVTKKRQEKGEKTETNEIKSEKNGMEK